jgi:hypothetical protein
MQAAQLPSRELYQQLEPVREGKKRGLDDGNVEDSSFDMETL